jgi:hypothetical protein
MKYQKHNLKGTVVQFCYKASRKLMRFFNAPKKNNDNCVFELSNRHIKNNLNDFIPTFQIIQTNKPPLESFMFFPLGKAPDISESYCFVAYSNKKIAGWAWLHDGMREDTAITYSLDSKVETLWFGPDYVKPKFRGASLQKSLIAERLKFAVKRFPNCKITTVIGNDNLPSIKSYSFWGFSKKRL